jgi:hypothetical protein
LNRLWRDPVWSKVIATGITAGIGALVVWYFHTQNLPPSATTPAPAIPAAPLAVTQHQIPLVEKWMDVPAAIEAFVPVAKNAYDEATKEVEHLQEEREEAQHELVPPDGGSFAQGKVAEDLRKKIYALQYHIEQIVARQQNALKNLMFSLTEQLKSGKIIAKGYDQPAQQWVSPSPCDWKYLDLANLAGDLTSISIRGGLSGQTHLGWVMFGKPLVSVMGDCP